MQDVFRRSNSKTCVASRLKRSGKTLKRSIVFAVLTGCRIARLKLANCCRKSGLWGGCRCQAQMLTGNAANTDPACNLSPHHSRIALSADSTQRLGLSGRTQHNSQFFDLPRKPAALGLQPIAHSVSDDSKKVLTFRFIPGTLRSACPCRFWIAGFMLPDLDSFVVSVPLGATRLSAIDRRQLALAFGVCDGRRGRWLARRFHW